MTFEPLLDMEMGVIGSLLLDNSIYFSSMETFKEEYFLYNPHKLTYSAIKKILEGGGRVDVCMLSTQLPEGLISKQHFSAFIGGAAGKLICEEYIKALIEHYKRYLTWMTANELSLQSKTKTLDIPSISEVLPQFVNALNIICEEGEMPNTCYAASEIADSYIKDYEDYLKSNEKLRGIDTGFQCLNTAYSGFMPGCLYIIAARPGMGKTAFALRLSENIARGGVPTLFFSLEMPKHQIVSRLINANCFITEEEKNNKTLSLNQHKAMVNYADDLRNVPLYIDATPSLSLDTLRTIAKVKQSRDHIGCVVIDYLQIVKYHADNLTTKITEISSGLKALARELNAPVIALSQLSREVEKRQNKRPMLSDLRESGAIEQDADSVIFLYRDDYYAPQSFDSYSDMELIISKNREGRPGTVHMKFYPQFSRFDD